MNIYPLKNYLYKNYAIPQKSNLSFGYRCGCNTDVFVKSDSVLPCLKEKENDFNEKLDKTMSEESPKELILFLQKEFNKKTKQRFPRYSDDIVQNALENVLEFSLSNPEKEDLKSYIIDIYETKLTPTKDDRPLVGYSTFSLDKNCFSDGNATFADRLTDSMILQPLSMPNREERDSDKGKLNSVISGANLTEEEKFILEKRLGNREDNKFVTYKTISEEENIGLTTIRRRISTTLLKIQKSNDTLPDDFLQFASGFKSRFNLDFDNEEMIDYLIENSFLDKKSLDKYEGNVKSVADKFKDEGLDTNAYLGACIKHPGLFLRTPDVVEKNVKSFVERFKDEGLDTKTYLNVCVKRPILFTYSSEALENNVRGAADKFKDYGLDSKTYLDACIKYPGLFPMPPDAVENNVKNFVDRFKDEGLDTKSYIKACKKQPTLFYHSPETLEKNIRTFAEKFKDEGLDSKSYLGACLKQPPLFSQSPDTIENNVRTLVDKFENYGLDTNSCIKACIKTPQLFCLSPNSVEKNVNSLVERFKDEDLDMESYIHACIKQPQLFAQSPDTIENNVRTLIERFKDDGLDSKSYVDACTRQPALFCQSPDTIENNVREVVNRFKNEGMDTKSYLNACIIRPSLFCYAPDTVSEHINAFKYVEKNRNNLENKSINEMLFKNLNTATSLIYIKGIIIPQIKKQDPKTKGWGKVELKSKLVNYLKNNPEKRFKITVVEDKMTDNFIQTIKDFCTQNVGNSDMFEFVVIDK